MLALLALIAPGPATAGADPAAGEFFGISAPELYSMSLDGRNQLRNRALAEIEAAGIDSVRTEIGWRDVEPAPPAEGVHAYDWTVMFRHVEALARHRQRLAPMILAPPAWAQPPASSGTCRRRGGVAPERVGDYAAFVGEVARMFGRDGVYWRWAAQYRADLPQRPIHGYEIWNEPNWDAFWCPGIDPETYADTVSAAADAIHAVDPAATVTIGGLVLIDDDRIAGDRLIGMDTERFLRRMTDRLPALDEKVDAVALHTYRATPADNLSAIGRSEAILDRVGLGDEPLVVSELGWHTGAAPGAVGESSRAAMLADYVDKLTRTDCDLVSVSPHSWITPRLDSADPEHWFGIADPLSGEPLETGRAYAATIARVESGGIGEPLEVCDADTPGPGPPVDPPAPPVDPAPAPPSGAAPPSEPDAPITAPSPAPAIAITKAPPRRTTARLVTLRFTVAGEGRVTYALDGAKARSARSPLRLRRLRPGRHSIVLRLRRGGEVMARERLRFRVVRR